MRIRIVIDKEAVYEEVAKTTSYTGAKMDEDPGAYDRIFTTDEDREQLERFWGESCTGLCEALKRFLESVGESGGRYVLELEVSESFDAVLRGPMEKEAASYMVLSIVSKWYAFTNKDEAGDYAAGAASMLEGVRRKACHKRKPRRPVY